MHNTIIVHGFIQNKDYYCTYIFTPDLITIETKSLITNISEAPMQFSRHNQYESILLYLDHLKIDKDIFDQFINEIRIQPTQNIYDIAKRCFEN